MRPYQVKSRFAPAIHPIGLFFRLPAPESHRPRALDAGTLRIFLKNFVGFSKARLFNG
jgi:hypothetical protein